MGINIVLYITFSLQIGGNDKNKKKLYFKAFFNLHFLQKGLIIKNSVKMGEFVLSYLLSESFADFLQ